MNYGRVSPHTFSNIVFFSVYEMYPPDVEQKIRCQLIISEDTFLRTGHRKKLRTVYNHIGDLSIHSTVLSGEQNEHR